MVQKILIALLNALIIFFEGIFQSKELPKNQDFSHDQSSNNNDQLEKDAYAFMELEPPVTMEQLKKQYKRLSLRYHPDRNNGSQEAHELQQKLNASFDLIQQALEGKKAEEQDDDIPSSSYEEQNMQSEEEEPEVEPRQHQQHSNHKKNRRNHPKRGKTSKRQRKRGNRRQQEMRQQMEREMDQEYQRWQTFKIKVQEEQDKIRRETSQRLDAEQRQAASRLFMNRVTAHDSHSNNPNVEKPKNYIMEACTDSLAVAIRLGMTELMLQLLNEESDIYVQKNLKALHRQALLEERTIPVTAETLGLKEIRLRIMIQPLDDDGNTILHYAVYWEQPSIIRSLVHMAQHDVVLDRMMLATNVHGHTPSDFANVAIDPSIVPLMQSQQSLAKIYQEQTKIGPAAVKAGKDFATILRNVDWATTLHSILGYWVGAWGFRLHWIFCILGVRILQNKSRFKDQTDKDPYFFEIAMTTYYLMCSVVVHWLYPAMIVPWWFLLILLLLSSLCCGPLVVLASPLYIFDLIQQVLHLPVEWFRKVLSGRVADVYLTLAIRRAAILVDVLIVSFLLQVWFSWVKHVDERR
jgi:curved DNA-binding protein CbpA